MKLDPLGEAALRFELPDGASAPALQRVLRWMPDVHRMLLFDCPEESIESRVHEALTRPLPIGGVSNQTESVAGPAAQDCPVESNPAGRETVRRSVCAPWDA